MNKPLRLSVLLVWVTLLAAFWLGARRADMGPLEYLLGAIGGLSQRPWAPAGLLALYLLRPLLLVPVTLLNLTAGFLLGAPWGVVFGMTGVLLSSTIGYGVGRFFGSVELAKTLSARWPLVRTLRSRSFETVLAGGLMYLHADAVKLPSGLLRIRFPVFLAGIALGNALTLVTAVLAGAAVKGELVDATLTVKPVYLAIAAALLLAAWCWPIWYESASARGVTVRSFDGHTFVAVAALTDHNVRIFLSYKLFRLCGASLRLQGTIA